MTSESHPLMQSVRHLMFYSGTFQAEREYRNFFLRGLPPL
jgi:hypothetical protein